jgi:hypothetical protein
MDFNSLKQLIINGLTLEEAIELHKLEKNEISNTLGRDVSEPLSEEVQEINYNAEILSAINKLTATIQKSNLLSNTMENVVEQPTAESITKKLIERK